MEKKKTISKIGKEIKGIKEALEESNQDEDGRDMLEKVRLAGQAIGQAVRNLFSGKPSKDAPAKDQAEGPATQQAETSAPKAPTKARAQTPAAPYRKITLSTDTNPQKSAADDLVSRAGQTSQSLGGIKGGKIDQTAASNLNNNVNKAKASVGSPANSSAAKSPSRPSSSTSGVRKPAVAKMG